MVLAKNLFLQSLGSFKSPNMVWITISSRSRWSSHVQPCLAWMKWRLFPGTSWNTEVSNSSLRVPEDVEIFGFASKSQTGGFLLEGLTPAFIYLGVKQLSLSYPLEIITGTHARSDDVHNVGKIYREIDVHMPRCCK